MLIASVAITLLVPAVNYHFIYPFFTNLLIQNTEEEAERAATHLRSEVIEKMPQVKKEFLPGNISAYIKEAMKDLQFIELKIFSGNGEVIFATEETEIGETNKHDYFRDIVARGGNYTKVVQEDTKSLEGKIYKADVVEAYVPIMRGGNFVGAFEIYYDITKRYRKLGSAILYFSVFPLVTMLIFLAVIVSIIIKMDRALTQQKHAETEAIMYAEKLRISNTELQEFAYIASHDLQEPLRKITAFGDRLKTKYVKVLDEQGLDYLGRMQNAARRMQNLINGLLMFSRVTTKAQPFVSVDLSAVTKEVLSDLEVRIQETGGKVDVKDLPSVEADPIQMRQLFQNLIGNALKFAKTDHPPVVNISGAYVDNDKESSGSGSENRKLYQITIEDNGIGFDEKYIDRIFGMFQRLHGRGEYEGTGIGLAVCKKIVERHKGSIVVKSAPDKGTKFIFTLPVKQAPESKETGT